MAALMTVLVSYLEGWQVIAEANRIFGFDGWQRQTIAVRCVAQAERLIGRDQKPGWGVTYTARVRVTVTAGGLVPLVREGSGAGHGIDVDLGQAHESALKEAETDAMKRALMTFGNPFGLALYDKAQRQVSSAAVQGDGAQRADGQRPTVGRPSAGSPPAAAASPAQGRTQTTAPTPPPSAPADLGQVLGQCPLPRAYFNKRVFGRGRKGIHDLAADVGVGQKILAQAFFSPVRSVLLCHVHSPSSGDSGTLSGWQQH